MTVDSLDTNLLTKKKKGGSASLAPKPISSRKKKILKITAYVLIFFFSLVLFLLLKLPSSIFTNVLLTQLNTNTPYSWQADDVSLHFFLLPHVSFTKLNLEQKFARTAAPPITIDELKVYPSLITMAGSAITGATSIKASFQAKLFQSQVSGSVSSGKDTSLELETETIDLAKVDLIASSGKDIRGQIKKAQLDINMEGQKLSKSDGSIQITGQNLFIDPSTFSLPIVLPFLDIGPAEIQGKIRRGKLVLEKFLLGAANKDLELKAEGEIQLADSMLNTRLNLKLRFKLADKIKKAVPGLEGMLGLIAAKRADGYYGTKLSGTFSSMVMPTPDPN